VVGVQLKEISRFEDGQYMFKKSVSLHALGHQQEWEPQEWEPLEKR
jgi:hypothetical protein